MTFSRTAAVLLLSGCAPSLAEMASDQAFELRPGATVALAGTGVRVTMRDVRSDSRCPIDVVCVTAGDAEVRLQVRGEGDDREISLFLMREPRAATVGAIRLELLELEPANRAAQPIAPADYRARLRWTGR